MQESSPSLDTVKSNLPPKCISFPLVKHEVEVLHVGVGHSVGVTHCGSLTLVLFQILAHSALGMLRLTSEAHSLFPRLVVDSHPSPVRW